MNNLDYRKKWEGDVKDHIRKVSRIIASVTHFYVLKKEGAKAAKNTKKKPITINLYDSVRFNMMAWPRPLPDGFSMDQFISYVEYSSTDSDLLGDGYILHGLDQFMALHTAAAIYPFLQKLNDKCVFYHDGRPYSATLFDKVKQGVMDKKVTVKHSRKNQVRSNRNASN